MKRERLGVAESVNAHQGPQDRRLLLGRRPADGGRHRPRRHARHQDQADRPRRTRADAMNKKYGTAVRRRTRSRRTSTGAWTRTTTKLDVMEHAGRRREHGRQDGLQHRQDDLREEATSWSRCTRRPRTSSSRTRSRGLARFRSTRARVKYFAEKGIKLNWRSQVPPQRSRTATGRAERQVAASAEPSAEVSEAALQGPRSTSRRRRAPPTASAAGSPLIVAPALVVMSLFHLYAAYAIVPTQVLRPVHVGFVLLLCFLMFPVAARFRHRAHVVGLVLALRSASATIVYLLLGRRRLQRPQHAADRLGHLLRRRVHRCWCWRRCAAPPAGSCR